MIGLEHYLTVAATLFVIGIFGLFLNRKNVIIILMSVELMLNAVNINLVAFWRYQAPDEPVGIAWALFVFAVAAAEAAVGLALVISVYRNRDSVIAEELDMLKY